VSDLTLFSSDFATARRRFREAVDRLGWLREAHPLGGRGPDGEPLTVDVAWSAAGDPECVLVVSSGVHGVEGFFGSAVQLALLERAASNPPSVRVVLLHGLNPHGFAWLRRFDEQNIDPNRNFLLPGESFTGSPAGYAALDPLLNPRRPPNPWEPFLLKALWLISRQGLPALRQAIATGQHDFPQGLFFGGFGPSAMHQFLSEHLPRWLEGSRRVVHLDFHTGLGPSGTYKLLIDYPLTEAQRAWLTTWFGGDAFETCDASTMAYDARGGLGRWCVARGLAPEYLFACAEFGTYRPIRVLAGLRAENQAHHWAAPQSAVARRTKDRLRELFCPAAPAWRQRVLTHSLDLIGRAQQGLLADLR
jgi:hypothetical protein